MEIKNIFLRFHSIKLDDTSTKAKYTNGILELKIKAKEQPKSKSKAIKVE